MNHAFLPSIASKYNAELVDQRSLWKQYLRDYDLQPQALLRDGVHLNERGCYLMAEFVKPYLRYREDLPDTAWRDLVTDYVVGRDVDWRDGKLLLEFEGNRVDVICKDGPSPPAEVRIDGKLPSQHSKLYALTRTTYFPGSIWPCLLRVTSRSPLEAEEWTITLKDVAADMSSFRFDLAGSKTGPDGEGQSDRLFVSKSGRVVIDPQDWNFDYARSVFKRTVGDGFQIRWKVVPQFVGTFVSSEIKDAAMETTVTLAQGLTGGRHALQINGSPETPIAAIRVYRPPLMPDKD